MQDEPGGGVQACGCGGALHLACGSHRGGAGPPGARGGAMKGHAAGSSVPHDMGAAAARAVRDVTLQQFVNIATHLKDRGRVSACREAFGDNYDAVRELAGSIKQHTLDHLDYYLEQFIDAAEAAGVRVHFAADGAEANAICVDIARANKCRLC